MPGERLRFNGGGIFVNDQAVPVPAVLAGRCRSRPQGSTSDSWRYRDDETIALGPDEYFLVGDEIEISGDSRIYGPTRAGDLIGVVDLIYWPPRKLSIIRTQAN
jgi:signal peptidase I